MRHIKYLRNMNYLIYTKKYFSSEFVLKATDEKYADYF